MLLARLRSIFLVSCTAAILAAGCSQGNSSLSPIGPSAVPDSAATGPLDDAEGVVTAASTAHEFAALGKGGSSNGGGKGGDKDKGKDGDDDKDKSDRGRGGSSGSDDDGKKPKGDDDDDELEDDDEDGPGRGRRGSLSGFVTAVGTDSITIRGIIVTITADTIIRHGHRHLTITDIHVGDHAQAKGTMSTDGKTLTATEVKVEDTGNDNDEDDDDANKVELRGAISTLGPTTGTTGCPTITFTVSGTTVKTNAKTEFEGVTCAALVNGNVVEVEGTKQTDGSVLAKEVELETGPDEVEGKVTAITTGTSCPTLTFSVGTATVKTTATTTYPSGTSCATIAVGKKIEAEGTKGADGVLTATSIEFD